MQLQKGFPRSNTEEARACLGLVWKMRDLHARPGLKWRKIHVWHACDDLRVWVQIKLEYGEKGERPTVVKGRARRTHASEFYHRCYENATGKSLRGVD